MIERKDESAAEDSQPSESSEDLATSSISKLLTGTMPWWGISLRGACMGAADVVPGVSGGTMALILGVYTRFIDALKNLNLSLLKNAPGLFIKRQRP